MGQLKTCTVWKASAPFNLTKPHPVDTTPGYPRFSERDSYYLLLTNLHERRTKNFLQKKIYEMELVPGGSVEPGCSVEY
jgi:hypothetical protein